jgi:hypothetical protein
MVEPVDPGVNSTDKCLNKRFWFEGPAHITGGSFFNELN